ncbi:YARHG domain-containing protein [Pseudoprevotella muciniphila]|uniref:YARHG domain-containing protein n=1 Tax=Pseudoprevotella muciniphila TaxID=2133944 RepID=A0A5P8E729_9BACT|nr:YARHG domain-containing protein [Pseudoprevotella muciniphila]QFQ12859.1 YARHG domain-containing protein [Pseudoprevotella muciniphila]
MTHKELFRKPLTMLTAIAAIAFCISLTSCDKLPFLQRDKGSSTPEATESSKAEKAEKEVVEEPTTETETEVVEDNSAKERIAKAEARTAEAEAAEAEAKAAEAEARAEAAKKAARQAQQEPVVQPRAPRADPPAPRRGGGAGYDPSSRYDWLSYRLATYDDISNMSRYEIKVMKNSIYARHHYAFQTSAMINHFSRKSWYNGYLSMGEASASFNSTERKNVEFLKRYE